MDHRLGHCSTPPAFPSTPSHPSDGADAGIAVLDDVTRLGAETRLTAAELRYSGLRIRDEEGREISCNDDYCTAAVQ